jgi:hypothetical protein
MHISQKSSNHYHVCSAYHYLSVNPLHEALGTIPELAAAEARHRVVWGTKARENQESQSSALQYRWYLSNTHLFGCFRVQ